jgi:DNA-binding XRE family transcriptional regulator
VGNNKQNYNGQYILKNRLKELRAEMNLSQTAFGKMVGVSKNSIISIETGRFCPTAKLALLICKALNVPDIDSCTGVMHTLFTLEDLYGFVIIEHDSQPVIKLNPNCDKYPQLHRMLLDWLKKKQMLSSGAITREEYDDWRYGYVPEDDT